MEEWTILILFDLPFKHFGEADKAGIKIEIVLVFGVIEDIDMNPFPQICEKGCA